MDHGYYYLHSDGETEPVLVQLYSNPDAKCDGFGFNTADGGGFLPLDHLSDNSRAVPVVITESGSNHNQDSEDTMG